MNLKSLLKETKDNISSNKFMFILTTLIITIIFVMGSFFISFVANTIEFNNYLKRTVFIKVYLNDEITNAGIADLERKFYEFKDVKTIAYKSKEIALQKMGESLGIEFDASENPLPDTQVIYLNETKNIKQIINRMKNEPGIDEIRVNMDFLEKITRLSEKINIFVLFFITGISVLIIIMMMYLIHFTILHRKDEIETMYYIGASRWYIKIPIMLESIISALVASIVNFAIYVPFYKFVSESIIEIFPTVNLITFNDMYKILILVVLAGSAIAIITSYFSVKYHLSASGEK